MRENKYGSVINISSMMGMVGLELANYKGTQMMRDASPIYHYEKGGMISFTRWAASVLGVDGVRVNCLSPGGFFNGQPEPFVAAYSERTQLGRIASTPISRAPSSFSHPTPPSTSPAPICRSMAATPQNSASQEPSVSEKQPYSAQPSGFRMRPSRVLRKIRAGGVARVLKLNTADAKVAEIFAASQPDALWSCMEHIGRLGGCGEPDPRRQAL